MHLLLLVLIPGTSSSLHLRQNLAAASLELPREAVERLDGIGANQGASHAAH